MNLRLVLPATLLGAALSLPAHAESVATGCLARLGGTIYNLNAYHSGPTKACRSGDRIVRVQLHQPSTQIAKRRFGVGQDAQIEVLKFKDPNLFLMLKDGNVSRKPGNCELVIQDFEANVDIVVASIPPGEMQDGVRRVEHYDMKGSAPITSYESRGRVIGEFAQGIVFHDLFLDHRAGLCFVSFIVEFAPHFDDLYRE